MQLSILLFISSAFAVNYATYPKVPKTASINGFADPILEFLPECAKECVKFSTGNTPCPYWDTGCFCVMPQWAGLVGKCVAEKCKGNDVVSATSLATSLCVKVGANTWIIPKSIESDLATAAAVKGAATVSAEVTTSGPQATSAAEETSSDSSSGSAETSASSSAVTSSDESPSLTSSPESSSSTSPPSSQASSSTSNGGFLVTANMVGAFVPIAALFW
jgi:cobalamin biosynthesis Mg chelatase CobN